jgi:asparaginyl-tRNA synthetase
MYGIPDFEETCLVLGREKTKATLRTQSEIMRSVREFLRKRGFLEILPPTFEPFTDPGIRGAKAFEIDYYGRTYVIMSALTLHKPILATHLGKIFAFCPCARKEPEHSKFTGRHLAQFYQIEVEIPEGDYKKAMELLERLIKFVIVKVKKECSKELKILGRDLKVPKIPFKRLTHKEAVGLAKKLGFKAFYDREIPWNAERAISFEFSEPFFIIKYPRGSRGFYDKDDGRYLLDFDLMFPEGFGEGSSGSEREWEYEKILEKMRRMEDSGKFVQYLRIIKKGRIKPTTGFGIGLERLTRFICGLDYVWEASIFPKIPGVVSE